MLSDVQAAEGFADLSAWADQVTVKGHRWYEEEAAVTCTAVDATATVTTPCVTLVESRYTKKFEGDDWKFLVRDFPELLREVFVSEASRALNVPADAIRDVEFRLGSLYVTFHVSHDEDISQEEMERRIEEYPWREMWRLYNQRDQAPDGVDAMLSRIDALEQEAAKKGKELEDLKDAAARDKAKLESESQSKIASLTADGEAREKDLVEALAKEQAQRKKAESQLKASEEQNKKLTENMKRERQHFEKTSQRQNDLIAAIVQENKKEKEAKEREYNEAMDVKDHIIEKLREQLRSSKAFTDSIPRLSIDTSQTEEFNKLMSRMEEVTLLLETSKKAETDARAEISRLSEELRLCQEAREAENITYQNDRLALKGQLDAFNETKLAEDHERRAEANRAAHGIVNVSREVRENETIVRQYQNTLGNIIDTLQDRLNTVREEFALHLKAVNQGIESERSILSEHEEDSQAIRQIFRSSSLQLQKAFWGTQDAEVRKVVQGLDKAAGDAERSSAAVKAVLKSLDLKERDIPERVEWMASHQQALEQLIDSLRNLNKRAFDRQLTLMNNNVTNAANNHS